MKETEQVSLPLLDWEEIRAFLVRRQWLIPEVVSEDEYRRIKVRYPQNLPHRLREQLSWYITGYRQAKGYKGQGIMLPHKENEHAGNTH